MSPSNIARPLLLLLLAVGGRGASRSLSLSGSDFVGNRAARLPKKIILGYADWCKCDQKIVDAAERGVNVLVWFNVNLKKNASGSPFVQSCTDMDCVAEVHKELEIQNLPIVSLISIGGWNSPHPDTSFSGEQWYEVWHKWNKGIAEKHGFRGFDGIDWDIEGNDDQDSMYNNLDTATLNLMGEMSQHAKSAGYIVAMAPAQSYLSVASGTWSGNMKHKPVKPWHNEFSYHGRNNYAYLIAKYPAAFDLVTLQLYEGWSSANYVITQTQQNPADYIKHLVAQMDQGWNVDFSEAIESDSEHSQHRTGDFFRMQAVQRVSVPREKLLIGLANGWAKDTEGKFLFVSPAQLADSMVDGASPRGFSFWNIQDEGKNGVLLAKELNDFMRVRPAPDL